MRRRLDGRACHRWRATCFVVALGLMALEADPLRARAVVDVNDPVFVGSGVVTLPAVTVPSGATAFQFTSNGVTFLFESLDGVSSLSDRTVFPSSLVFRPASVASS